MGGRIQHVSAEEALSQQTVGETFQNDSRDPGFRLLEAIRLREAHLNARDNFEASLRIR